MGQRTPLPSHYPAIARNRGYAGAPNPHRSRPECVSSMSAAVLGVGAVTSIGLNAVSTAAAQRAGIAGHADHPFMIDRNGDPMVVARVPWGNEDMDGVARMVELAVPAARAAIAAFRCDRRVDLLLALPETRPGLPH